MPKRSEIVISRRTVDALSVEGADAVFRDRALAGFGVRVYPFGRKTCVARAARHPTGLARTPRGRPPGGAKDGAGVRAMVKPPYRALSSRTVDALPADGREKIYWDAELTGFGVRVHRSGSKAYVAQARGPRGSKRVTLGRHGVIATDEARRRAALALACIRSGEDPAPAAHAGDGPTVADLAQRYFREHVALRCKPGTAAGYRQTVDKHLLPALGAVPIVALGRAQVAELHHRLRATPAAANHAIATLSRMLNLAEAWGLLPAGGNPCRFVPRYRTRRPERFLTGDELRRLGRTLDALEVEGRIPVHAAAALRLLMLTGCRRGEILTLRWEDVDLDAGELRLADSKTGPRTVALSPGAARVLAALPRVPGTPWVVAGHRPGTRLTHITHYWYRTRERAGLGDVRLHDLRHSFASRALALGEDLTMIGKLLGHGKIRTTARYAHLARNSVRDSAARVAASIAADLGTEPPADARPGGDAALVRSSRRLRTGTSCAALQ